MKKIKITREQEEALKSYKIFKEGEKELEYFIAKKHEWKDCFKSLKDFTPLEFSVLLHGWYEVEYPFKVGDWFEEKGSNKCVKITRLNDVKVFYRYSFCEDGYSRFLRDFNPSFEKVKEPWKIMLLELGRDKPEFKVGDKYITRLTQTNVTISNGYEANKALDDVAAGNVKYIYPVESRIEVKHAKN